MSGRDQPGKGRVTSRKVGRVATPPERGLYVRGTARRQRPVAFDWPGFVRQLRSDRYVDCTQEELAREMGVSTSSVTKWEAGAVTPQPRHRRALRRLAVRFGFFSKDWPGRSR
jgi:ribosome-binding protein aMBF1 (putative translation factor)